MHYKHIFKEKEKFNILGTVGAYQFKENKENGEIVDENGNTLAQIYDANPNRSYFVVAGMFLGEMIFKPIYYSNTNRIGGRLKNN